MSRLTNLAYEMEMENYEVEEVEERLELRDESTYDYYEGVYNKSVEDIFVEVLAKF